ncbi:MAG: imidazole glycerol phosphate synthase subunit HisH [Campylobacteraceae bacterium]|jgi:glutamine amidotransferase|nr:imidazole glycerol phosphate synthase subunit HisH [Campylobacteraceae bacterium]
MIAIIDYSMGNLQSVINAIEKVGKKAVLVKEPKELGKYQKAILPGVGAFGDAMKFLNQSGMNEAVKEFASSGKALLGICLGMQLLFEKSLEFGEHKGLGLIEGEVVMFDKNRFDNHLKVPHVGWNSLKIRQENPLLKEIKDGTYLYFVHSFHVKTDDKYVSAVTHYGYDFPSVVKKNNIFGFQPHPEKSHENGLKIYKNFMEI